MSVRTVAVFVVMGDEGGYEVGVDEEMALCRHFLDGKKRRFFRRRRSRFLSGFFRTAGRSLLDESSRCTLERDLHGDGVEAPCQTAAL
jgi:hypothetical protein